jgi:hypothetical protein
MSANVASIGDFLGSDRVIQNNKDVSLWFIT